MQLLRNIGAGFPVLHTILPGQFLIEITRGEQPVKWVRLDAAPFTDRLVHKFRLPVTGWRGPRR